MNNLINGSESTNQHDENKRKVLIEHIKNNLSKGQTNLSSGQRRLWTLLQMDREVNTEYFFAFEIKGNLDFSILQQSFVDIIQKNAILRSSLIDMIGMPLCIENLNMNAVIKRINLEDISEDFLIDDTVDLSKLNIDKEKLHPSSGQLIQLFLVKISGNVHYLILKASKFIFDKHSARILIKQILATYHSFSSGSGEPARYSQKSYSEFVIDEKNWLEGEEYQQHFSFWKSYLSDLQLLQLPTDKPRPLMKTHNSSTISDTLPIKIAKEIEDFSASNGISEDIIILSGFMILLSQYTSQNDITIGLSGNGNRTDSNDSDHLIGPIENTLIVRFVFDGKLSFHELTKKVNAAVQEIKRFEIPFSNLVDALNPARDLSRTPFFQVMFSYQDISEEINTVPDLEVIQKMVSKSLTDLDLSLTFTRLKRNLYFNLDYNLDLYEETTIRRLLSHLYMILDFCIKHKSKEISKLSIIDNSERNKILLWNNTDCEFPIDKCLHELFCEQAKRTPSALAVSCQGTVLTYAELDKKSNQLANYLKSLELGSEAKVSICLYQSIEIVIAILGILKAGYTYVPLDPEYPLERLEYMLVDCDSHLLITQLSAGKMLDIDSSKKKLLIDTEWEKIAQCPSTRLDLDISPDRLAYMIYTSGSTGAAKAVMITHRGIVNNLSWRQKTWALNKNDKVLQNTSFSFDPSVWSTFWPLISGAQVIITAPNQHYDSKILVRLIKEQEITLFGTVPSLISLILDEPGIKTCSSLRYILSGGEILTRSLQQKVFSSTSAQLANLYGPTETTIDATFWQCDQSDTSESAPIGRPIANLKTYILNEYFQIVPVGVPGQIFVGGTGIARGYHNRPGLTAERFLPNPFSNTGERIYKTGDLGRYKTDGRIEFLGRIDEQVKVRGYRIELNEIDILLNQHPNVKEAICNVYMNFLNENQLVAYVSLEKDCCLQSDDLTKYLGERLPSYMIPSFLMILDKLPKMPNGKINRSALPVPSIKNGNNSENYIAPRTPIEQEISQAFLDVLGLNRISIHDDFFSLGGTSLMLARLASQLLNRFEINIPMAQFFRIPTIHGVAEVVSTYQQEGIEAVMAKKHATRLEEDTVLDDNISSKNLIKADYLNPKVILLTGSTGYLGAFLLEQLINKTNAEIYCLVRALNEKEALARIHSTMSKYRIWDEKYKERIYPIAGDLSLPQFGLSDQMWEFLAKKTDSIHHSGAMVNFAYPYTALRASNVLGTKEILRLACQHRLKAVHYISTIDTLLAVHADRPFLENDDILQGPAEIAGGYTASKWVAEKIVNIAMKRGVPACIYRPGLILGQKETGAVQTNDYLLVAFAGFVSMGIMPEYPRIFDTIPVDYAASAITHISMQPHSFGKFFHLFNPAPVPLSTFYKWTETFGYRFDVVDFEEARRRGVQVDSSHPLYPLVPLLREADPTPPLSLDPLHISEVKPELECLNTFTALKESGISCQPTTEDFTHRFLQYLIDINFLQSPKDLQEISFKQNDLE
uniref:RenF n=1 Tax=Candidatus Endohaliclona renieramycinifaciens TaxID=2565582 RepID=A0A4D6G3D9_9GAMM|nr:RenF [Candidatus Endohaliclona renieramycinifaciens]QCC21429.1 RenF [Candidatus Endohaliclona renieramycinifaciens]